MVYIINNDIELDNLHVICTTQYGDDLDFEYSDCIDKFKNTTSIGTQQTVNGNVYSIDFRLLEQFAYQLDFKYITSAGSENPVVIENIKLTTTVVEKVFKHIALQEDINSSDSNIPDDYVVPDDMIMLQSNENKNILIPCSETEYIDISSLPDSLEKLFNVDKMYGYESDVVGKLKIKQCRKIAIITSVIDENKFTHKHVSYDMSNDSLTLLAYNDSHYSTGIQNIIFNDELYTFNIVNFALDIYECVFDKSFEFYMDDTCKINVSGSNIHYLTCTGIDVSNMTDMCHMFFNCTSLTTLNVLNWDTSNVTYMRNMFYECTSLTTLDVSTWDTSNVTKMSDMFRRCISLTTLNLLNWDTSNVTDMSGMFNNCYSLTSLDLSAWNTSKVTDMRNMFNNCYSLTTLDVSTWDTSKVKYMRDMFNNCYSLTTLDVSTWNTINITDITGFSDNDINLATIIMTADIYDKIKACLLGTWIQTNTNTYTKIDNNYVLASNLAYSNEESNNDTSLPTTAFVHNCVNDGLTNYYTKTECDERYASKNQLANNIMSVETKINSAISGVNASITGKLYNYYNKVECDEKLAKKTELQLLFEFITPSKKVNGPIAYSNLTGPQAIIPIAEVEDQIKAFLGIDDIVAYETEYPGFLFYDFQKANSVVILSSTDINEYEQFTIEHVKYSMSTGFQFDLVPYEAGIYDRFIKSLYYIDEIRTISTWNISQWYDTIIIPKGVNLKLNQNNIPSFKFVTKKLVLDGLDTSDWTQSTTRFDALTVDEFDATFFKTSNWTEIGGMFQDSKNLKKLDCSSFDLSNIDTIVGPFYRCTALTTLNLTNWDLSKFSYVNLALETCTSLKTIYMSDDLYNLLLSSNQLTTGQWKRISYGVYEKVDEEEYYLKSVCDEKFAENVYDSIWESKPYDVLPNESTIDVEFVDDDPKLNRNYKITGALPGLVSVVYEGPLSQEVTCDNGQKIQFTIIPNSQNGTTTYRTSSFSNVAKIEVENRVIHPYALAGSTDDMSIYVQKRSVPYHVQLTSGPTVTRTGGNAIFTYTFDKPVMNGLLHIYNRIPSTNERYHYVVQITNGTSSHGQFTISNNVCKLTVGDDGDVVDYYDISNITGSDQVDAEFVDTHMLSAYVTKQELWSRYLNKDECAYKFASRNTTITHYAPIDDSEIDEIVVGKPVFMSGYVYKQNDTEWVDSTINDTQDCICSVKAEGTWKEFVGIIVSIDAEKNCLTFATHGDYLFKVTDSAQYSIGDAVLYDGTIVNEDTPITLKIQQSIIGKVSGKIDQQTIAVFKD